MRWLTCIHTSSGFQRGVFFIFRESVIQDQTIFSFFQTHHSPYVANHQDLLNGIIIFLSRDLSLFAITLETFFCLLQFVVFLVQQKQVF